MICFVRSEGRKRRIPPPDKLRFLVRYNAQLFAIAAEQLLQANGVSIFYGTTVCVMKLF